MYSLCHSPGSEADFVVLSTVRCKPLDELADVTDKHWLMDNLGHVTDSHRLCVALTRARYGLVIIGEFLLSAYVTHLLSNSPVILYLMAGNQALLSKDPLWKELVDHCKERNYMVYRNESRKFPPQRRMNQARTELQRKEGRLRKHKPQTPSYPRKPKLTSKEYDKEIHEAAEYYNELWKIVKFFVQGREQLSSLTVTIK